MKYTPEADETDDAIFWQTVDMSIDAASMARKRGPEAALYTKNDCTSTASEVSSVRVIPIKGDKLGRSSEG